MNVTNVNSGYHADLYEMPADSDTVPGSIPGDSVENAIQMPLKREATEEEKRLGVAFLRYDMSGLFEMTAEYTASSTTDNPIVKVTVNKGNGVMQEYEIAIHDINPKNATEVEMFALCCYADGNDMGTSTASTWELLSQYRNDAFHVGYLPQMFYELEITSLEDIAIDWTTMVEHMMQDYYEAGNHAQYREAGKLLTLLHNYPIKEETVPENSPENGADGPEETASESVDPYEFWESYLELVGEGAVFTEEDLQRLNKLTYEDIRRQEELSKLKLILDMDSVEMRELRAKKLLEQQILQKVRQTAAAGKAAALNINPDPAELLDAEKTTSIYPASPPKEEDTLYITMYSESGIYCRKKGESGFEWHINFSDSSQYDKVMEFLQQFEGEDNLWFACHANFWQDFLSGELDQEGFMNFWSTRVTNGIPSYIDIIDEDTMTINAEAARYSKYMNQPGLFHMIRNPEELLALRRPPKAR